MNQKISIIMPCYILPDKDAELLTFTQSCIDSINQHLPELELVIVDNGSPLGGDYLRDVADVYVRFQENRGFAPAVNAGLRVASGEWLVVCNNDITFLDDWVSMAIQAWKHDTGVFCSHLHDHDPSHQARIVNVSIGHFFGALWMTRRDVIEEIGYLDEGYKIGMFEDKDFAQRLLRAGVGYRIRKGGWCKHIGNATWGKMPNQHETFVRNKNRYEEKWSNT